MQLPFSDDFIELMDRAWERELALLLGELAHDLEQGNVTVEQAHYRLKRIAERKEI